MKRSDYTSRQTDFIRKWANKELADNGDDLSPEYSRFLGAMSAELRRICKSSGIDVRWIKKEDYTLYAMLKKGRYYIYLEYSNASSIRGRTFTDLTCNKNVTMREAMYEGDLLGGENHYSTWDEMPERLSGLFERIQQWYD